jgi:hypothetical protein
LDWVGHLLVVGTQTLRCRPVVLNKEI